MPQTLTEYVQWLSERNLRWPAPPDAKKVRAEPHVDPLPGLVDYVRWPHHKTTFYLASTNDP